MSSIIGWVFGTSMSYNGGVSFYMADTFIFFVNYVWSCLIIFMIPIYDLSSFENSCKSLAWRSSSTCRFITFLELSIIFGCSSLGKVFNAFSLRFLMIMLGRSNKLHLVGYTWMVEDAKKVLVGMNWDCDEQANLVTYHKWPMPSLNTLASLPSLIAYLIWKVKKFLDP
jgi:hypothetical protein